MQLPSDTQRHLICGMTGSGKTVLGMWTLSYRCNGHMPWIIIDSKRDPFIERIPRLEEIDIGERIPKRGGLYVVRPMPIDYHEGVMSDWLYKVWARENTGLFVDEGYSFSRFDQALQAVLTQGRSKRIPVIALSQRPSWISPFLLSESEHKTIFFLQHSGDIDRVQEWMPAIDPYNLPPHHCYWYSVISREFHYFGPCPGEDDILDRFDQRPGRRIFL